MAKPRKPRKPGKKIIRKRVRVSLSNKAGATQRGRRMAAILGPTSGYEGHKTIETVVDVPGSAAAKDRAARKDTPGGKTAGGKRPPKAMQKARAANAGNTGGKRPAGKQRPTTRDPKLVQKARAARQADTKQIGDLTPDEFDARLRAAMTAARNGEPGAAAEARRLKKWGEDRDMLDTNGKPRTPDADGPKNTPQATPDTPQATGGNEKPRPKTTLASIHHDQDDDADAFADYLAERARREYEWDKAEKYGVIDGADDTQARAALMEDVDLEREYNAAIDALEQWGNDPVFDGPEDEMAFESAINTALAIESELEHRGGEPNPFHADPPTFDTGDTNLPTLAPGTERDMVAALDDDELFDLFDNAAGELADLADHELERRYPWRDGGILQRSLAYDRLIDIKKKQKQYIRDGAEGFKDSDAIREAAGAAGNPRYIIPHGLNAYGDWYWDHARTWPKELGIGEPGDLNNPFPNYDFTKVRNTVEMQAYPEEIRDTFTQLGYIPNIYNWARIQRGESPLPYNGHETVAHQFGRGRRRTKDEMTQERMRVATRESIRREKAREKQEAKLDRAAARQIDTWDLTPEDARAAADAANAEMHEAQEAASRDPNHKGLQRALTEARGKRNDALADLDMAQRVQRLREERDNPKVDDQPDQQDTAPENTNTPDPAETPAAPAAGEGRTPRPDKAAQPAQDTARARAAQPAQDDAPDPYELRDLSDDELREVIEETTGDPSPDVRKENRAAKRELRRRETLNPPADKGATDADTNRNEEAAAEKRHKANADARKERATANAIDGEEVTEQGNIRRGNALMWENRDGTYSVQPVDGERVPRGKGLKADTLDDARKMADDISAGDVPNERTADNAGRTKVGEPGPNARTVDPKANGAPPKLTVIEGEDLDDTPELEPLERRLADGVAEYIPVINAARAGRPLNEFDTSLLGRLDKELAREAFGAKKDARARMQVVRDAIDAELKRRQPVNMEARRARKESQAKIDRARQKASANDYTPEALGKDDLKALAKKLADANAGDRGLDDGRKDAADKRRAVEAELRKRGIANTRDIRAIAARGDHPGTATVNVPEGESDIETAGNVRDAIEGNPALRPLNHNESLVVTIGDTNRAIRVTSDPFHTLTLHAGAVDRDGNFHRELGTKRGPKDYAHDITGRSTAKRDDLTAAVKRALKDPIVDRLTPAKKPAAEKPARAKKATPKKAATRRTAPITRERVEKMGPTQFARRLAKAEEAARGGNKQAREDVARLRKHGIAAGILAPDGKTINTHRNRRDAARAAKKNRPTINRTDNRDRTADKQRAAMRNMSDKELDNTLKAALADIERLRADDNPDNADAIAKAEHTAYIADAERMGRRGVNPFDPDTRPEWEVADDLTNRDDAELARLETSPEVPGYVRDMAAEELERRQPWREGGILDSMLAHATTAEINATQARYVTGDGARTRHDITQAAAKAGNARYTQKLDGFDDDYAKWLKDATGLSPEDMRGVSNVNIRRAPDHVRKAVAELGYVPNRAAYGRELRGEDRLPLPARKPRKATAKKATKKAGGKADKPTPRNTKAKAKATDAPRKRRGNRATPDQLVDGETINRMGNIEGDGYTIAVGKDGYTPQVPGHNAMQVQTPEEARRIALGLLADKKKRQAEADAKFEADRQASIKQRREDPNPGWHESARREREAAKQPSPQRGKANSTTARKAPAADTKKPKKAAAHKKGQPFTGDHLQDGETLTKTGAIQRGDHTIISGDRGYHVMQQYDHHRLMKPVKTLAAARKQADRLQAAKDRKDNTPTRTRTTRSADGQSTATHFTSDREPVVDGIAIDRDRNNRYTVTDTNGAGDGAPNRKVGDYATIEEARAARDAEVAARKADADRKAADDDLMRLPQRERDIAVYDEFQGDSFTTSEVAEFTGLTPAQARDVLRRLEANGLVFRSDNNDKQGPGTRRTVSGERTSMDDLVWTDAYRDDRGAVADAVNAYDPKKGAKKPAKKATDTPPTDPKKQQRAADAAEKHAKAEKAHAAAIAKVDRAMRENTTDRIDADTETAAINAAKAFIRERNAKAAQLRAEIAANPDKDTPEARKAITDAEKATKGAKVGNIGSKEFKAVKNDIIAAAQAKRPPVGKPTPKKNPADTPKKTPDAPKVVKKADKPDPRMSGMAEPGSALTPDGVETATPSIADQIRAIVSPGGKINVERRKAERESELGVKRAELAARMKSHPEKDTMPPSSRSLEWHQLNAELAEAELAGSERRLAQFERDIADFKSRGATDKQLAPLNARRKSAQAGVAKSREQAQAARKQANAKAAEQALAADAKKPADLTTKAPGGNKWEVPRRDEYPAEFTKIGPDKKSPEEVAQWLAEFATTFKGDRKSDESISIQFQDAMVNAWEREGNTADVDHYLGMYARGVDDQNAEFMVGTPGVAAIDAEKLARARTAKGARKVIDEGLHNERSERSLRMAREIIADPDRRDPKELAFVFDGLTDDFGHNWVDRPNAKIDADRARMAADLADRLHEADPDGEGYTMSDTAARLRELADLNDKPAAPAAPAREPNADNGARREASRAESARKNIEHLEARAAKMEAAADAMFESERGNRGGGIQATHNRADMRNVARSNTRMADAARDARRAQEARDKADQARRMEKQRNTPDAIDRRIKRLEADIRKMERESVTGDAYDDARDDLAYWRSERARNFDDYVDEAERARRDAAAANPATRAQVQHLARLRRDLEADDGDRVPPVQPIGEVVAEFIREMDRADERAAALEGITDKAERRAARKAFNDWFNKRDVEEWLPEAERLREADAARFDRILYADPSTMSKDEASEAIDAMRGGRHLVFQPMPRGLDGKDGSKLSPMVNKDDVKRLRESIKPQQGTPAAPTTPGFVPPGSYIGPNGIVTPDDKWGTV